MYTRAQRYMKRRHPRKSGWCRTEKYWGRTLGRQDRWVFQDKARNGTLRKFAWTKIVRHRLVPTTYSPDDPTLQDYWRPRRAKPQVTNFVAGNSSRGNKASVRSVTSTWKMARDSTCIMWFPRKAGAKMTARICGWFITTATVRFTAAVRLLGYVDGLSRVLGDGCARFCGEGVTVM